MKELGGLGAMTYGAYAIYYANMNPSFDTTPMWWLQVLAAIIVGGYFAFSELVPHLWQFALNVRANMAEGQTKAVVTEKEVVNDVKAEKSVTEIYIDTLEDKDMASLYYLTERCKDINDGAAYKLCRDLNDVFFTLHHPQKTEDVKGVA